MKKLLKEVLEDIKPTEQEVGAFEKKIKALISKIKRVVPDCKALPVALPRPGRLPLPVCL